jgi:hypothetical protein
MLLYPLSVSAGERALISAIRQIVYGEIFGAEIPPGESIHRVEVSHAERSLVMEIRNGLQRIDVIHIHEGRPAYLEVDEKIGGFHSRRKIKIPTG